MTRPDGPLDVRNSSKVSTVSCMTGGRGTGEDTFVSTAVASAAAEGPDSADATACTATVGLSPLALALVLHRKEWVRALGAHVKARLYNTTRVSVLVDEQQRWAAALGRERCIDAAMPTRRSCGCSGLSGFRCLRRDTSLLAADIRHASTTGRE